MARHQSATEELTQPMASRRPRVASGGWPVAALLAALAGGLGYHSFTLHQQHELSEQTLSATQTDVAKEKAQGRQLLVQLRTVEAERAEQRGRLAEASARLQSTSAELAAAYTRLDELDAERGQMNEQIAEFQQMTRELARMIDSGRLKVSFRRGRMIVELPAQVLFSSGSADLSEDGKEALAQVAKSLRGFKSRHFIVAGHTDNVPVPAGGGRFASNWELSSARAVTVTGALIRGGLQPEQLVAAGYGEYDPIARNTNEAGKQKNRRIEIILEPRLRELKLANADTKK